MRKKCKLSGRTTSQAGFTVSPHGCYGTNVTCAKNFGQPKIEVAILYTITWEYEANPIEGNEANFWIDMHWPVV